MNFENLTNGNTNDRYDTDRLAGHDTDRYHSYRPDHDRPDGQDDDRYISYNGDRDRPFDRFFNSYPDRDSRPPFRPSYDHGGRYTTRPDKYKAENI